MGSVTEGYDIPWKPGEWGGVEFKSKLEAKWARAFDESGAWESWLYEHTTYDLGAYGKYTPDFHLFFDHTFEFATSHVIVEIKYRKPLLHECVKTYALQRLCLVPVLYFVGEPEDDFFLWPDAAGRCLDAGGYVASDWTDAESPMHHRVRTIKGLHPKLVA